MSEHEHDSVATEEQAEQARPEHQGHNIPPLSKPVVIELRAGGETQEAQETQEPQEIEPSAEAASAAVSTTPPTATSPSPNPTPRTIALMNQKGGVGKTTTVVNIAAAMARQGKQVLTIDLDPQAHLSLSLGIDPEQVDLSVYHLLTDRNVSALQVVHEVPSYTQWGGRLAVIPAEVSLAGVESELAEMVATGMAQTVLRNKLKDLIKQFDIVLIDCPPSLGLLTINALTLAREVIVPMQAHFLALQGLSKLFETVQMVNQGINPNLCIAGVVLCMHESNTLLAGEVVSDLNGFMEQARGTDAPWSDARVFQPPVRRNIKLAESPSFGQPIFDYAPDSHGAKDYAALAQSITAHQPAMARG